MELLEIGLEALEDLDGVLHRRLHHVDLLETPRERAVLLEVLAVFLVGGRTHAAQSAALKRRLQEVRSVHGAAGRRAGPDHRVDLVDEEDGVRPGFERLDHLLDPLLEIAAVARAGEQRAHIQRVDHRVFEDLWHLVFDDLAGQTLGDGRLADARITHQKRVVLAPAAQHLDAALHLVSAPDQRIDSALARLSVQIDAIG